MITKEGTDKMVAEQFECMQSSLNALEIYLEDVEINTSKIGFEVGKITKEFQLLVALLDIKLE